MMCPDISKCLVVTSILDKDFPDLYFYRIRIIRACEKCRKETEKIGDDREKGQFVKG